jgi:pyridoxal phosphate enzyme (YggS family)
MRIKENFKKIRNEIPEDVQIIVAAKKRSLEEVREVIRAGAKNIGENYLQEGINLYDQLGELSKKINWHFIGNLQKNDIKKALEVFDDFQTIDSLKRARQLNFRAGKKNKIVSIFLEINIGNESFKSGIKSEFGTIKNLAIEISKLENLKLNGLMPMGPKLENPEEYRYFFKKTKEIFDRLNNENLNKIKLDFLSMGMSDSYKIAIEEGANMIRLGTKIFGKRS